MQVALTPFFGDHRARTACVRPRRPPIRSNVERLAGRTSLATAVYAIHHRRYIQAVVTRVPDARYQGIYAEYYVRTLALASDINVATWAIDDHGVDLTLRAAGRGQVPKVDIQVKSWSTPHGTDLMWHFDRLTEVQYNQLLAEHDQPRRVLVVLIVPRDDSLRTEVVDDGLLLRHRAYFTELSGPRIEMPNPARRRKVMVPRQNLLTAKALRGLVHPQVVPQRSGS
jgi:uncharacterized protein DUF4365